MSEIHEYLNEQHAIQTADTAATAAVGEPTKKRPKSSCVLQHFGNGAGKGEHKPSHPIKLLRFQQAVRQQSRRLPCMRARQPDAFPSDFISAAKLWQYDHVSGSYLSMLNSSFETEQTETRCQDSTVERLERRIAELESQVKDLQQERHKTSVTPPRMPQMPKSLQNFSNTMQKATLPTNGSMQTNRSSLQTNGSPANGSPANGSSAHGSSAHEIIESAIGFERRMPKALAKAMRAVFTEEQLATCSFKGGITTNGDPRVGLPEAEREAVIGFVEVVFPGVLCPGFSMEIHGKY
ncbi:hypothetical protein DPMN_003735 [Dreissena polymorpha]|uniref:BEN domain-containing protein n=1 Tax=Dreissena polymorpha TaxID=45954 RepID=A0A9D4MMB2_DREPO|nr:hypothetical protein DPMN_003735 [Dreissena polymorpha]